MFVGKKRRRHSSVCTLTVLILHAQHIHEIMDPLKHTNTHSCTWIYTHVSSFMAAEERIFNVQTCKFLRAHTTSTCNPQSNKKTMMRQPPCCVFSGLLTISQLAPDQQTKAVISWAETLCINTKDRVWWHLTKQPAKQASYFQTDAVSKSTVAVCLIQTPSNM